MHCPFVFLSDSVSSCFGRASHITVGMLPFLHQNRASCLSRILSLSITMWCLPAVLVCFGSKMQRGKLLIFNCGMISHNTVAMKQLQPLFLKDFLEKLCLNSLYETAMTNPKPWFRFMSEVMLISGFYVFAKKYALTGLVYEKMNKKTQVALRTIMVVSLYIGPGHIEQHQYMERHMDHH